MNDRGLIVSVWASLMLLMGSTVSADLISDSGLVLDTDSDIVWYSDLTDFVNMDYSQQQAAIAGLNESRFGGMTGWHLATQSDIDTLRPMGLELSPESQARFQSLGASFTPTTYLVNAFGSFSGSWYGRTGIPSYNMPDTHHDRYSFGKSYHSLWGDHLGGYPDDRVYDRHGAWVAASAPAGLTIDDPLMPVTPPSDPSWGFDFGVTDPGTRRYIDPLVATGYDFVIDSGPNIASALLPLLGDNSYDLWLYDATAGSYVDSGMDLTGGVEHSFGPDGVSAFRILGIEEALGIDPSDPTAFRTGLTFTAKGIVSMHQTPLTTDVAPVPLPGAVLLGTLGLAYSGIRLCRKCER